MVFRRFTARPVLRSSSNRIASRLANLRSRAGVSQDLLQMMMRHSSYQTTKAFYIDLDGDELAEDLYRIYGRAGSVLGIVSAQGPGPVEGQTTQPFTE